MTSVVPYNLVGTPTKGCPLNIFSIDLSQFPIQNCSAVLGSCLTAYDTVDESYIRGILIWNTWLKKILKI